MAKKNKFKLTTGSALIIAVIVLIIVVAFGTSGQTAKFYAPNATNGSIEVATPFAVDAWNYTGWGNCASQDGGLAWANKYCMCEGHHNATSCWHEWASSRWTLQSYTATAPTCNPGKGRATYAGYAFTKVRCVK